MADSWKPSDPNDKSESRNRFSEPQFWNARTISSFLKLYLLARCAIEVAMKALTPFAARYERSDVQIFDLRNMRSLYTAYICVCW